MINHDESYLNRIVIESRTQGNCDGLKILLKNRIIASRFNQELFQKRRTSIFIKEYPARNVDRLFRDEIRVVRLCETGGIVAHDAVHVLL